MTSLPTIVYRIPGPNAGPGFTWASKGVDTQEAFDLALSEGWHPCLPDAESAWRHPPAKVLSPPQPAPVDDSAPTRAEIEQKCRELGISVHHKHSDATLVKKIEEALTAKLEAAGGLDQT